MKYFYKVKNISPRNIKSFFGKVLLQLFLVLKSSKTNKTKIDLKKKSKVLIIRLGEIEDALVITPLISILKEKTNCEITVLANNNNHFIFSNNPNVTDIIGFDEDNNEILKTVRQLKKKSFDVLIDTQFDDTSTISFIIGLCSAKNKIAFKKNNWKLFTNTIEQTHNLHIIDEILLLANQFSFSYSKENINVEYFPTLEAKQKAINFIIQNKLDNTKPLVGVNISAGSNDKFWGVERFRDLVKYFEKYDINVIILHSLADKEKADQISRSNSVVFPNESFNGFAAMINGLDFLFTPDSSAVQLAASKQIPIFILYLHKEIAKKWCPYRSPYDCVITEEHSFLRLSYGKTLNSFIPFFENFYNEYFGSETKDEDRETLN